MIAPPRAVESILEGLGATDEFRESLLGDLAQEFAERVEGGDVGAARRWYYREAIRATPHLLRNWLRAARARDATHLIGIVLASWVTLWMLTGLAFVTVGTVVRALGLSLPHFVPGSALTYGSAMMLALLAGLFGGSIGAGLNGNAPLIGALAVGTVFSCVNVSASLVMHVLATSGRVGPEFAAGVDAFPVWQRIGVPLILFVSAALGGALRVRASTPLLHRCATVQLP